MCLEQHTVHKLIVNVTDLCRTVCEEWFGNILWTQCLMITSNNMKNVGSSCRVAVDVSDRSPGSD